MYSWHKLYFSHRATCTPCFETCTPRMMQLLQLCFVSTPEVYSTQENKKYKEKTRKNRKKKQKKKKKEKTMDKATCGLLLRPEPHRVCLLACIKYFLWDPSKGYPQKSYSPKRLASMFLIFDPMKVADRWGSVWWSRWWFQTAWETWSRSAMVSMKMAVVLKIQSGKVMSPRSAPSVKGVSQST